MLVLKSSDGELFEIEEAIALQSQTISLLVEDDCANNEIPLANVSSHILSMVIDYCKRYADADSSSSSDELKKWDDEFIKSCDQSTIFNLILAANYLNIKSLLALTCQAVADMISGKTPDEIREIFNIENDFTPEEEEEIRKENEWAFE